MSERIVIFRNGSIGNTLVCVPAVRALRRHFPDAFIAMVLDPVGADLLSHCPYIDEILVYDKRGRHRSFLKSFKFAMELRRRKFTKAFIFKRFFRNELLSSLAGVPERYGYLSNGHRPFRLTHLVKYVEGKNIIELNLDLVRLAGVPVRDAYLEMWASEADKAFVSEFIERLQLSPDKKRLVFHCGGTTLAATKWPIEKYAQLISELLKTPEFEILVLQGPGEGDEVQSLVSLIDGKVTVIAGLSLPQTVELIRSCDVFVGSDSGPAHLAEAVGTKGVILYPPLPDINAALRKWKPPGDNYIAITVSPESLAGKKFPLSPEEIAECNETIKVKDVISGIRSLID